MAALLPVFQIRRRQPRTFHQRVTLANLTDREIEENYRLRRHLIESLANDISHEIQCNTRRSNAIPPITKVLVGLRYLSKGDFLSETAGLHGISKTSASKIVESVVEAINRNVVNIRFPHTTEDADKVKLGFYRRCGIPNVVGAIDGTLVPIIAPVSNPDLYICRKGFHALNIQAVVDSSMRFIDVVAKWPGSQHDAAIFDSCGLKEHLEISNTGHLLGDSGYPLRKYLLTPIVNPDTPRELRYNAAHARGRSVVETAFGILKARFRCLHKTGGCLPFSPEKSANVVLACMKLHNICVDAGMEINVLPAAEEPVDDLYPEQEDVNIRNRILSLF